MRLPPGGACAQRNGSYPVYRFGCGRTLVPDDPAPTATAVTLAPGAPVPALVLRPVAGPPRAPRALSRDLLPGVDALASTVPLLLAEPPTPPSALAPVARLAAGLQGAALAPSRDPP